MRPVGAPQPAFGQGLDEAAGERQHVAIRGALAVERRRPGDRELLGTAHLRPDVPVVAHDGDEALELGPVDQPAHVGTPHAVDDHRVNMTAITSERDRSGTYPDSSVVEFDIAAPSPRPVRSRNFL